MQYREFGKTGKKLSLLGFGAMRLPFDDEEKSIALIRRAVDLGVNYIDTAVGYGGGSSEVIVGKAVADIRDKVYVSTKNPLEDNTADGWWSRLNRSLEKMKLDRIDFYQVVHGLNWKQWEENFSKPGGGLEAALRAKDEGIIGHICFSFHDTCENLIKLIDTGVFEGVTLQYNMLDRSNEPGIQHAYEKGLGVVVMGPVGGGRLGAPSPEIVGILPEGRVSSTAELALRFVFSNPYVTTAISGMSTMEMVEENCRTASLADTLSSEEIARINKALADMQKLKELYCTGCGYCMPCPNGVNIPVNFTYMNYHRVYGLTDFAKERYSMLGKEGHWVPGKKASECVECGECEPKCPQNIPIIKQLKETAEALGE
jgi:predicted aldo/keto reductase-like oxidoreductase